MRDSIIYYGQKIILAIAALISIFFFTNNLRPLDPGLYSFAIICIIGVAIFWRLFTFHSLKKVFQKVINWRYVDLLIIFIAALVGLIIRLYFFNNFQYAPVSDPITFYESAQKIAQGGGMIGNSYVAFFPYLAAYNGILGFAMGIIGNPWLATIVLNTLFDFGAALIVYFLVRGLTSDGSRLPTLALAVWILNPFNILFSVISLPIVIVNFFIVATVYLIHLLFKKIKNKDTLSSLVLALAIGIAMGVGGAFRPVFSIILIAVFLLFLLIMLLQQKKSYPLLIGVFSVISITFFLIGAITNSLVSKSTNLIPASSASGWSIFVGSNWNTDGKWNREDEIRMSQICSNDDLTRDDCHSLLRDAGVERYKSYGFDGTISLLIRKLYVFSSNQGNTYNAYGSIVGYEHSKASKVMDIYITIFMFFIFLLSSLFFYRQAKYLKKGDYNLTILLITFLLIGFFLSTSLVEVSERYAQVMYPILIVAAILALSQRHTSRGTRRA